MGKGAAWQLASVLLVCLACGPAQASPDDCSARAGTWDAAQSRCVARVTAETYTESVQVPVGLDGPAQAAADETLGALRAKFEQDAVRATRARPFSLSETYEQIPGPNGVVNIVMTVFAEIGEHHPVMGYRTLVLQGGRRLGLADLFRDGDAALADLYPIVKADLERKLLAGQSGEIADLVEQDIVRGTGVNPENYQHFVLAPDELRFLLLPHQVASYAAGPQTGHVPLAQIRGELAPGLL
ncbi:MAG: RsiV family protein [Segniliparus sp.]|uniref:RsiV family protein n=1 Tax=Segniliparus sp. TaxID=2804064 RepID=UPI003F343316